MSRHETSNEKRNNSHFCSTESDRWYPNEVVEKYVEEKCMTKNIEVNIADIERWVEETGVYIKCHVKRHFINCSYWED